MPCPYDNRCPFGLRGEPGVNAGLRYIEQMLSYPESGVLRQAAEVVEAVPGEGGGIPAPARWLRALRRITREHGIALVLDEVQTELGRTRRTVQRECLQRGLTVELGGRHGATVRFLPPLVINEAEIDLVAELFGEAVVAAQAQCR